jgi:hypothetical protein
MNWMDGLVSVALGLGLAAAAGFRVFVPLLVLSVVARVGYLPLAPGFEWMATTPALTTFAVATVIEIAAYYVPWVDNLLDTVATPAAVMAGVIATASVVRDLPPLLRWAIALIGGGGAAGLIAGTTSLLRLKSTASTAGLANPVLATIELVAAVATSVLALVVPLALLAGVITLFAILVWRVSRRIRSRSRTASV